MKTSPICLILVLTIVFGCKTNSTDSISGTYVNKSESEYSVAYDTLIVQALKSGNSYQIDERTGYQRFINKTLQPKQFKQKTWQATWDADKSLLAETQYGRQLFFNAAKKMLVIKGTEFTKIP